MSDYIVVGQGLKVGTRFNTRCEWQIIREEMSGIGAELGLAKTAAREMGKHYRLVMVYPIGSCLYRDETPIPDWGDKD